MDVIHVLGRGATHYIVYTFDASYCGKPLLVVQYVQMCDKALYRMP
jgi:hypothetical protein